MRNPLRAKHEILKTADIKSIAVHKSIVVLIFAKQLNIILLTIDNTNKPEKKLPIMFNLLNLYILDYI